MSASSAPPSHSEWRNVVPVKAPGPEGREVRLPTEFEWEKAARGVDGRWFPWGSRFDASCCNMTASRRPGEDVLVTIDALADRFPADVSIYGVRGAGGNVGEWTATAETADRDMRGIKGGCWNQNPFHIRSANRGLLMSTATYDSLGFRLVWAPRAR